MCSPTESAEGKMEEISADLKALDLQVDESSLTRKQRQMLTSVRRSFC